MINGKTVVYTSGTFDMLHINHLKMIEYARALGDILIVGINTDELVSSYKSMPIIPFEQRIALMKAIKGPDIVIPQKSLDHFEGRSFLLENLNKNNYIHKGEAGNFIFIKPKILEAKK